MSNRSLIPDRKRSNSKQKRVLIASIVLAGVITIGGTFAWFTSQDEVTNKLTATSNYGVSIVESFTPPSNWVPGQEVTKEVSVTNTGNVDAFVKLTLSSFFDITTEGTAQAFSLDNNVIKSTTSQTLTSAVVLYDATKNTSNTSSTGDLPDTTAYSSDTITSIQAGGRLIYGVADQDSGTDSAIIPYENSTMVGTEFAPKKTGLYIFERAVSATTSEGTTYTYTYDGYYYVEASTDNGGQGTYYAINIPEGAIVRDTADHEKVGTVYLKENQNSSNNTAYVTLRTTTTSENAKPTYDYTHITSDTDPYILATYTNNSKTVKVRINLSEKFSGTSGTVTSTNWTLRIDKDTFYYNEVLQAGTSSKKLIKSLTLDDSVTADDYIDFDYYLTLTANSVQVVYDSDGNIVPTSTDTTSISSLAAWSSDPVNVSNTTLTGAGDSDPKTYPYTIKWDFTNAS